MSDGSGHGECINNEWVERFAAGEVDDADQRTIIEKHLDTCEFCQQKVAELSLEISRERDAQISMKC